MKGDLSDWEYENPACYMDASHMAFTSTFLFHKGASAKHTIGTYKDERQFPHSRRFNHVLDKDAQCHYFSYS